MRSKNMPLWVAVLWFAVSAMWIAIIALRLSLDPRLDWLCALQGLVVLLSLAAGVVNLLRWRAARREQTSENSL